MCAVGALALISLVAASCSDDDGGSVESTVAPVTVPATVPTTETSAPAVSDSETDASPTSPRNIPSLDEVGHAEFTHTVVAGDFLSRIAGAYGVEIDDIVGANQWADGRDHLLLPGDTIYLPAGAEMPEQAPLPDATGTGGAPSGADVVDPSSVCANGKMVDTYRTSAGDTIEGVAARLGLTVDNLVKANGVVAFTPPDTIWVHCTGNWPPHVSFGAVPDGEVCLDTSILGLYDVQQGDTAESIADALGVTVDQLQAQNDADLQTLSPPQQISVCDSWLE